MRIEKLIKLFPENADAFIVTDEISIKYLCGFAFTDGCLVLARDKSYLVTDFRYIEDAERICAGSFDLRMYKGRIESVLEDVFAESGIKNLLYEDDYLSCRRLFELQKDFPAVNFYPSGGIIASLMEIKDEDEVKNIIFAQKTAEEAIQNMLAYIGPDVTEKELANELEFSMKRSGADGKAFDIVAINGISTSLPHGTPRDKYLEKGFLTIDFGAKYNGYCSDMTRTFSLGIADEEMKKVYSTVLEAQSRALEALDKGERNCVAIDACARKVIDDAGFSSFFGHGLGHGVGLRIHEAPRLSPHVPKDKTLLHGHVVTVEPGIYIPGKFGVRIEDMVYIGENSVKNLTNAPKELIQL